YPQVAERYNEGKMISSRDEVPLATNGDDDYFDLNITPIKGNKGETLGQVIVLRDITDLKEREKSIELLKDVQSRVLRHNLRNELTLIRGWAEVLGDKYPEDEETFDRMVEVVDKIIERGEKARSIEQVIDHTKELEKVGITQRVEDAVMSVWSDYSQVKFTTDLPDETYAYAIDYIETAIKNLVENAAEHNDADEPRVDISVEETEDWVEIKVADNGPGMPEGEIEIIEDGEETPLRHGSGVGLWLVDWVVRECEGELVFDSNSEGTTVTMKLQKVDSE
ncbi:MAG: HAMP domain-containing sensor histidine kinase, partial [Halobacteria archaeon]|nr:HAMP domain-containing sensor histidine kinase [Halobacteria archaeon]